MTLDFTVTTSSILIGLMFSNNIGPCSSGTNMLYKKRIYSLRIFFKNSTMQLHACFQLFLPTGVNCIVISNFIITKLIVKCNTCTTCLARHNSAKSCVEIVEIVVCQFWNFHIRKRCVTSHLFSLKTNVSLISQQC